MGCKVIKVTNIPLQITKDILYTMFEYIGKIEDIKLYPVMRAMGHPYNSRIGFIKYKHSASAEMAHFLNNTPLIDRTIQVTLFPIGDKGKIPSEEEGLKILVAEKYKDPVCMTWIEGIAPMGFYKTTYKPLEDLPPYPDLPAYISSSTVEEIRRTLVVANLDHSISGETLVDYFSKAGEVKYARFCQRNDDPGCYALVEFVDQESVISGLKLNNSEIIEGIKIKVYHSVHAINKYSKDCNNHLPVEKSNSALLDSPVCATNTENEQLGQSHSSSSAQPKSRRRSRSRSRGRKRDRSPDGKESSSHRRSQSGSHRSNRSRSCERNKSRISEPKRSRSRNHSSSRSHRSSRHSSRSCHQSKSSSYSKRRSRPKSAGNSSL